MKGYVVWYCSVGRILFLCVRMWPCHPPEWHLLKRRTEELNATIEPTSFENAFNLHEKLQRLPQFQDVEGQRRCTTKHVFKRMQNDAKRCKTYPWCCLQSCTSPVLHNEERSAAWSSKTLCCQLSIFTVRASLCQQTRNCSFMPTKSRRFDLPSFQLPSTSINFHSLWLVIGHRRPCLWSSTWCLQHAGSCQMGFMGEIAAWLWLRHVEKRLLYAESLQTSFFFSLDSFWSICVFTAFMCLDVTV